MCPPYHLHVLVGSEFIQSRAKSHKSDSVSLNNPAECLGAASVTKSVKTEVAEVPFLALTRKTPHRVGGWPSSVSSFSKTECLPSISISTIINIMMADEQSIRESPSEVYLKSKWKEWVKFKNFWRPPPLPPVRDSNSTVTRQVGASWTQSRELSRAEVNRRAEPHKSCMEFCNTMHFFFIIF